MTRPEKVYRNEEQAWEEFPKLIKHVHDLEALLKNLRGMCNKGLASDDDVEDCREAKALLLGILDRGNWKGRLKS